MFYLSQNFNFIIESFMISFWYYFVFWDDLHNYFLIGDHVFGNFDFVEDTLSNSLTKIVIS